MANLFGTLNRFISRLDSDPSATDSGAISQPGRRTTGHGFQILRNTNSTLPLEPWFDFIIGINGHNIDNPDPHLFSTELRNCAGSTISLGIYSAKGQTIREIYHAIPADGSNLGLSLQWAPLAITDDVWHILDVMPNSPGDVAGLLPYGDFVLGSPDGNLKGGDAGLGTLVEAFTDQALRLYVYNHEYDVTRLVTITPSKTWGGEGALGCVLGYGALHRIPAPLAEPAQGPGETLFESEERAAAYLGPGQSQADSQHGDSSGGGGGGGGGQFFVPANAASLASPPPTAGNGAPPGGRAKKARTHHAPVAGLDDYFAEGEKQSRERDNAPTPKPSAEGLPPPPPPKGGSAKAASPALEAAAAAADAQDAAEEA